LPFSFVYDGQPSASFLPLWEREQASRDLGAGRTEHTINFRDPKTGLVVRCVVIEYSDFPVTEWTLYFANAGAADTPILSEICALDMPLSRERAGEFTLHHINGSFNSQSDFQPHKSALAPLSELTLKVGGGWPTEAAMPYFNIARPGGGVIAVLGWPGNWKARFTRDSETGLHIEAGQGLTHFALHPGEEVRSPLSVALFYDGDWMQGQNEWRRWMVAHNLPRTHGQLPPPIIASAAPEIESLHYSEANQKRYHDLVRQRGLEVDYWWIDAGWYECGGNWPLIGTWDEDKAQFPSGLRSVVDHGHALGIKQVLWFEPERVTPGTKWDKELAPWLIRHGEHNALLNLGDPDALTFLTDFISGQITEKAIDVYRQDFNFDIAPYWRVNDTEDRQGITEIKYVTGLLAFWDELRARHPDLLIDTCASGGRRNDLETLRRALPLLRSDYRFEPIGTQNHAYGIALWMPYHGTGGPEILDAYNFRTHMSPCHGYAFDYADDTLDYELLRKMGRELREVQPFYFGDYYPLTPYNLENNIWLAWQYHRPEQDDGIVQVFRRADSSEQSKTLRLLGLDAAAEYHFTDADTNAQSIHTGRELMETGLTLRLETQPSSALLKYKKEESPEPPILGEQ